MLNTDLLQILRCPEDHSTLSPADAAVLNRVNTAIREGRLINSGGTPVEQPLDGGLLRADGAVLYPIVDHIPVLLRDDGIALNQLND